MQASAGNNSQSLEIVQLKFDVSTVANFINIENLHEYQNDLAYCCEEQLVYRFLVTLCPLLF